MLESSALEQDYFNMNLSESQQQKLLADIYAKYKYLLYTAAKEVLQDDYLAEDAVHNAFIKISRNLDKIDDIESFRTKRFLITIAKNAALDIYRKRKLRWDKEINISDIGEIPIEHAREMEDAFEELFFNLPQKYKDVLFLKVSDYSNKETAQILGITEFAVQKRFSRAKQLLRKSLKGEGRMHE